MTLTRHQATQAFQALDVARKMMVAEANRITRKRGMSPADHERYTGLTAALANLQPLVEALGTEHSIGGY